MLTEMRIVTAIFTLRFLSLSLYIKSIAYLNFFVELVVREPAQSIQLFTLDKTVSGLHFVGPIIHQLSTQKIIIISSRMKQSFTIITVILLTCIGEEYGNLKHIYFNCMTSRGNLDVKPTFWTKVQSY